MEAVGQLTGGLAHDFNNLLAVALGNLELLRLEPHREDSAELIAASIRATQRGAELTQRLLAFSRRQALEPAPTDVNRLVQDLIQLLRRTLGEPIEIDIRLDPEPWSALIDRGQLETALLNLAVNARDAMETGGQLIIETSNRRLAGPRLADDGDRDVAPGDYVAVAVTDTGSGMSSEVRQHIFEPFFTTKPRGRGTGLGLSMVYGFVKQSGGHVTVSSQMGCGTTVTLYLPRSTGRPAATVPAAATGASDPRGNGELILVVEDDPDVRRLATAILRSLGYAILEAEDAAQGLRILERGNAIELLFTDVVLPGGKSGLDLAAQARVARPDLKVLFMTGYAPEAAEHHLARNENVIAKPFHVRDLARTVDRVLRG
jgi:CheY-like chemotaxis protein